MGPSVHPKKGCIRLQLRNYIIQCESEKDQRINDKGKRIFHFPLCEWALNPTQLICCYSPRLCRILTETCLRTAHMTYYPEDNSYTPDKCKMNCATGYIFKNCNCTAFYMPGKRN